MVVEPIAKIELKSNVLSLSFDDANDIWAGTGKGLYQIDMRKFTSVSVKTGQVGSTYSSLCLDSHVFAASWDKRIVKVSVSDLIVQKEYAAKIETGLTYAAVTGDKKTIAVCTSETPGEVHFVSTEKLELVKTLSIGKFAAHSIAAKSKSDVIAIGDRNGTVRQYKVPAGTLLSTTDSAESDIAESLAYAPTADLLAVGYSSGVVSIINQQRKATALPSKHRGGATALAFAPSGSHLFVGFGDAGINSARGDNFLACWNLKTSNRVNIEMPASGLVQALAVSTDGKSLAVGTSTGIVLTFDLPSVLK